MGTLLDIARPSIRAPVEEYRINYTTADLAEFDALIERYCAVAVPELLRQAKREELLV